jgi:hypothetical protein
MEKKKYVKQCLLFGLVITVNVLGLKHVKHTVYCALNSNHYYRCD